MSKTCLVCNAIHLEMIGILRHPRKMEYMLNCLLGLQAQQDDYLCNKCCNDVINAFDSKQKSHQFSLLEPKILGRDGVVAKEHVDQGDQSANSAFFDVSVVKIEPKGEGLEEFVENANDETTVLQSKVKQERGVIEKYERSPQRSIGAMAGGKRESNSARLNGTVNSSRLAVQNFNATSLDSRCKQNVSGGYVKREKSVDIDEPNYETNDRNPPNNTESINSPTGNRPANKKYACSKCEKSFNAPSKLKVHERIHTGEKPYKCAQCEKGFMTPSDLKKHERVHTGEKPYKCCECGKGFSFPFKLKVHERVHTGEKSYTCRECEKSFITLQQLKIHDRTHTGERPYKCCKCKKGFITSHKLKLHEWMHTGERPYRCCECEKSFITTSDLKKHTRIHSRENPFSH